MPGIGTVLASARPPWHPNADCHSEMLLARTRSICRCADITGALLRRWLLSLLVAVGLVVVHAHLPGPDAVAGDLAGVTSSGLGVAGADLSDPPPDGVVDVELVGRGVALLHHPAPSLGFAHEVWLSSRSVLPSERPPRNDRFRA